MSELTEAGKASVEAWLAGATPRATHEGNLLVKLYRLGPTPGDVVVGRLEEQRSDCKSEARVLREPLAGMPSGN